MQEFKIENMYDLNETIAADLMRTEEYPWQILPKIKDYIKELGKTLPADKYEKRGEDVWIAKNVNILAENLVYIAGPCIIDEEAEIRPGAFIRGSVIIGKGAVVGNSTELKNAILFNKVQVPHYNYIGDSILGYKSHMGAGAKTSNVKSDKTLVVVKNGEDDQMETGLKKFGAMLGDNVEVGCNTILNPGTVIGRESNIYPVSSVRGCVPAKHIFKDQEHVVSKN